MRPFPSLIAVAVITVVPACSWANGLLYELPPDGSQAVYEMTTHVKLNGGDLNVVGTLTLSSVGKVKAGGKNCRWIEITTVATVRGRNQTATGKILIPEEDLGKGKDPFKNPQKGWFQLRGGKPKAILRFTSPEAGPLPAFLVGPLAGVKKLEPKKIESGLGKLACAGETGTRRLKDGNKQTEITYTTRLNAKSPFGVVSSKMVAKETRNGMERVGVVMTFKLKSVAKNAKSKLPEHN